MWGAVAAALLLLHLCLHSSSRWGRQEDGVMLLSHVLAGLPSLCGHCPCRLSVKLMNLNGLSPTWSALRAWAKTAASSEEGFLAGWEAFWRHSVGTLHLTLSGRSCTWSEAYLSNQQNSLDLNSSERMSPMEFFSFLLSQHCLCQLQAGIIQHACSLSWFYILWTEPL